MNNSPPGASSVASSPRLTYTHWIYALHALSVLIALLLSRRIAFGFASGLPSIVAVIMNYARRAEVRGTWLESHFRWQIRTFWYAWLWIVVSAVMGAPLLLIGIGYFIAVLGFGMVGIWVIYRVARGWIALREGHAMPALRVIT